MTAAKLGKNKHKRKKKSQYIPIEVKNAVYTCHKTTVAVKRQLPPPYHALRKEKKFHAVGTVVSYG